MATIGTFDETLLPLAWFDETATPLGWFDPTAIGAASATTAIPNVLATLTGPFNTSSATFQDIGCTATLTQTGFWLIVSLCSHYNNSGSGAVTDASSMELRWQSTRYGTEQWCSLFGSFAPSIAAGSSIKSWCVINATSGDQVSLWLRSVDIDGGGTVQVSAGDASLQCIFLGGLTRGTDWEYAEGPNSDTAEAIATGTSWIGLAAAGRIGQGAGEVPFTAPANGDYWVLGYLEGFLSGTPGTAENSGARIRIDGAAGGTGVEHHITHNVTVPQTLEPNFVEEDVQTWTAGHQPEIEWEINNTAAGQAAAGRRSRVFILRLGVLANYAFIVNSGNIQVPSSSTVEAANGLTFDFGTAIACMISSTATWQTGGGNWGRAWLNQDDGDIHWPLSGRIEAVFDEGTGATDDEVPIHFGTIITQSGSVTWRLAEQTDSGANPYTLGRDRGDTTSARTILLAMQLATAGTPVVVTADLSSFVFTSQSPSVVLSAVVQAPSADSVVFDDLPATIALSGITRTQAADSCVFDDLGAAVSLSAITRAPSVDSVIFDDLPAAISNPTTMSPATDAMVFTSLAQTIAVGAISVTASLDTCVFDDLAPTVSNGTTVTPASSSIVFDDLDPTTPVGPVSSTAGLDSLVFDDLAATVAQQSVQTPAASSLVFDDLDPSTSVGAVTVGAAVDSIAFDDLDPTIVNPTTSSVAADSMVFTSLESTIAPGNVTVAGDLDSLLFNDIEPTTSNGTTVTPANSGVVFDDLDPTITVGDVTTTSPISSIIFGSTDTAVTTAVSVSPAASSIIFDDVDPTVGSGAITVSAFASTMMFADQSAAVGAGELVVLADVDSLIFDDLSPTATQGFIEHPASSSFELSSIDPIIGLGNVTVEAPLSTIIFSSLPATIGPPTPPPPPPPYPVPPRRRRRRRGGGGGRASGAGFPVQYLFYFPPSPSVFHGAPVRNPRNDDPDAPLETAWALAEFLSPPRKHAAVSLALAFLMRRRRRDR